MKLTTLVMDDLPKLVEWFSSPAAKEALVRDRRDLTGQEIVNLLYSTSSLSFGLVEEELVGVISLYDIDWVSRKGTVGNLLTQTPYQALKAVRLIINYAFRDIGLHRVDCHVWPGNRLTPWICVKIGARFEGTIREGIFRNGAFEDIDVYSMLDREMKWD